MYAHFYDSWQPKNEAIVDGIILEKNPFLKGAEVIDCGCSTGDLSYKLNCLGAKVTGIDISKKMLKIASKKYKNDINWVLGDFTNYLVKKRNESLDLIVSKKSLYDVSKIPCFFSNAMRTLRDNRQLIVVLPNQKSLKYLRINGNFSLAQGLKYSLAKLANALNLIDYKINPEPMLDSFNDFF